MLKLAIWVLLAANAAYFAWSQGHLGPWGFAPTVQSEPERLKAQIRPESMRLINGPKGGPEPSANPAPAPASPQATPPTSEATPTTGLLADHAAAAAPASAPDTACWQAGGFSPEQATRLREALSSTDLPPNSWRLDEAKLGGRWLVYMGRFSDDLIDRKKSELNELNVPFRTLPPPLGPGLALGTFPTEAAAEQGLADVVKKGVRTARVVQERTEASVFVLRLPSVTDAQRAVFDQLGAARAGKRLQACG